MDAEDRLTALFEGVFTGNIFDLGSFDTLQMFQDVLLPPACHKEQEDEEGISLSLSLSLCVCVCVCVWLKGSRWWCL